MDFVSENILRMFPDLWLHLLFDVLNKYAPQIIKYNGENGKS